MATVNEHWKEARGAPRRTIDSASTVRTDGSGPIDVLVRDLSETGVRIRTPAVLEIGQEISIGLAGAGLTRAFVVWRGGDHYGCVFDEPIGAADAARAFSASPVIHLGQLGEAEADRGAADLRDIYRQHRFWHIPADALVSTAVIVAAFLYLFWYWLTA
jgi:Co/Zn/Cd efflux system component